MVMIKDSVIGLVLDLAKQAGQSGEVPIGAVLMAPDGQILGSGFNRVEQNGCQIEHAEVSAILEATRRFSQIQSDFRSKDRIPSSWRLDGCTLLVNVEPCLMCFALAKLSRIKSIVYMIESPVYGFSKVISFDDPFWRAGLSVSILGDRDAENASRQLMQNFFRDARAK